MAPKVRIDLSGGETDLEVYGYGMRKTPKARHRALVRAVQVYGPLAVFHKLNALQVLNKNDDPDLAAIARSDKRYVGKKYDLDKSKKGFQFTPRS
jgi:hypothetical protein